jgi:predicted SAM-dependent methyltransferase
MVKINMMCGPSNFGSDWVHVDTQDLPHVSSKDIYLAEYPDECADRIYCSHGIAYFDREEIKALLREWVRVLKPQGQLRLSTPDWDFLRTLPRPLIGPLYGKMNNPPIYHKTVYSYDELYKVLRDAGFIKIDRIGVQHDDQSCASYDGKLISLNIQCIKP